MGESGKKKKEKVKREEKAGMSPANIIEWEGKGDMKERRTSEETGERMKKRKERGGRVERPR